MSSNNSPILIVGGNGKTGARVNTLLQAQGYDTRPVSRSTSPSFDWENPQTWEPAIQGTRAAYVTYQPDLAVPGAPEAIAEIARLAKKHGLERVVLLSGRGEEGAQNAEKALQTSGVNWTIVRAGWFAQNFSENFMLEGIQAGELMLPAGDIPEPFIDIDDIADVVVAALTRPNHGERLYEVTGPRAITFAEAVEEISQALGRPVKYTYVPVEHYIGALREDGLPESILWLLNELFTTVLDGRNSQVMHGVEDALGRKSTDFSDYIQKVLASGVWTEAAEKSA